MPKPLAAPPYKPPRTPWAWGVATGLGTGFLKPGPGTWGSAVAMLLWWGFAHFIDPTPQALRAATILAALIAIVAGIPAASLVERELGKEDPGMVIIDEMAGQWVALLAFCGFNRADFAHGLVGLALFRVFDIVKPPPARQLERLHGGAGIMFDDIAAGVYALLIGAVISHWW